MAPEARCRRTLDLILIGLFLAALIAPTVDQLVRPDLARGPTTELRLPAPRPGFPTSWDELSVFPKAYDAYFADTFGLRDVLLRWNSLDKLFVFGTAPSSTLLVGKDDWIFYTGDVSIPIYRGLAPFTVPDLRTWQRQLELRRDALAARDIAYVYVIAPNKETVYPDRMPAAIDVVGPSRREQFVAWMKENSTVDVLDLTESFRAEREHDSRGNYLYNQYGTHWSGRGSFQGYRDIVNHIGTLRTGVKALEPVDIEWHEGDGLRDTWSKSMYIQNVLLQRDLSAVPVGGFLHEDLAETGARETTTHTQASDPSGTRVLLFHDSFGPFVRDLLAEHFSSMCTDWAHYDTALVVDEDPNVVVEMYVERIFVVPTPGPGESPSAYDLSALKHASHSRLSLGDARAPQFESVEGMRLEYVHEGEHDVLRFASTNSKQGALSAELDVPLDRQIWVEMTVSAARSTTLDLYWKSADAQTFLRSSRRTIDAPVVATRQRLHLELPSGRGRILLRPHDSDVPITISALTVR